MELLNGSENFITSLQKKEPGGSVLMQDLCLLLITRMMNIIDKKILQKFLEELVFLFVRKKASLNWVLIKTTFLLFKNVSVNYS